MVSFTHQTLYSQGKNPWYPLDRSLDGPEIRDGRGGEEKEVSSLPLPVVQPVVWPLY